MSSITHDSKIFYLDPVDKQQRYQHQHHLPVRIRPFPSDGNYKADDNDMYSLVIIVPSYILNQGLQDRDNSLPLCWHNKETKGDGCDRCSFCNCLLDKTTGYYKVDNETKVLYLKGNETTVSREFINSSKGIITIDFIVCFHKECIEPIQNNPYHPNHSLKVLMYYLEEGRQCYCCYSNKKYFHYCISCDFRICHECVQEQPLLTIKHQIRHKHTLNYIQRKASITCDICGLDDRRYFIYMCYQCDFVVHKECIYFPRTIRISRHDHPLNFTSSSSFNFKGLKCTICHTIYDGRYGGYSCFECMDFIHSKCAIDSRTCDGKELEGKPEDTFDNVYCSKCYNYPFPMRFHKEIDKANEKEKQCQACALPICDGNIFSCIKCDFVLHKKCARQPRIKFGVMHPCYLYLHENTTLGSIVRCSACKRVCNSYIYYCEYQFECPFYLDANCASIPEALNYHSHNHLLFQSKKTRSSRRCSICQNSIEYYYLECEECDIALCFCCATLPKKLTYKHDEHPLVFTFGQDVSGQYWCDMCEDKINQQYGIYMCNDCNITLHVGCLVGEYMSILPGKSMIKFKGGAQYNCEIIFNDRLTRYICKYCHKRCQDKFIFKTEYDGISCSVSCLCTSINENDFSQLILY